MRVTSFASVIRHRLTELGLAQIPSSAIAYIEAQMVQELSKIAARKITVSFVSKSIIKAQSRSKNRVRFHAKLRRKCLSAALRGKVSIFPFSQLFPPVIPACHAQHLLSR